MNRKKNPAMKKPAPVNLAPARKRLFILMTVALPLLLLVVLELCLRLFDYGGNTKLFVSTPNEDSQYLGINLNIGRRYFPGGSFNPSPRKDLFLKVKPQNGYRIFVLGGSTTAGFPYGNNITFPRILNRRLADTFPNRKIEVVNTAMTAINSYSQLDFMNEILAQQPDAILIYAGHNEFYGALGVGSVESLGQIYGITLTYLRLQRLKVFCLVRDVIGSIRQIIGLKKKMNYTDDPMATIMARIVKDKEITLDSQIYERGKRQFRNNLLRIFKRTRRAKIPVIISELVSNTRDQEPFVSLATAKFPAASSMYAKARTLEQEGNYDLARKAYYLAKDLDALRFRATEEFNEIIHELANEFDIPVVPMKQYFEENSPHGMIGNNLICDHLHPTIDGYFLMADAFYNTMRQESFITSDWPENNIKPTSYYRRHWGYTQLDSTYAALVITHLKGGWPFQTFGPNQVLFQFSPITVEDSLALEIVKTGKLTLEMAHDKLASYYLIKGEYHRALDEYLALIYEVPYLDLFYKPAIDLVVAVGQYELGAAILEEALKYNESFLIYKWLGQFKLVLNDPQLGINYLEKALELGSPDEHLLYNLARAYYNTSQIEKGDLLAAKLKAIYPGSAFIKMLADRKN